MNGLYIKVVDGTAAFATALVHVTMTQALQKQLPLYQCEPDAIVCYSDAESTAAQQELTAQKVAFTVEPLTHNPQHVAQAKGVVYDSRTEAMEHLTNNTEVRSQRFTNLAQELAQVKAELAAIKAHLKMP